MKLSPRQITALRDLGTTPDERDTVAWRLRVLRRGSCAPYRGQRDRTLPTGDRHADAALAHAAELTTEERLAAWAEWLAMPSGRVAEFFAMVLDLSLRRGDT